MAGEGKLIKVGRRGIEVRGSRIPASFFRHLQPGKSFVVLAEEDRRLMHVRTSDVSTIWRAYVKYEKAKKSNRRGRGSD